MNKKTIIRSVIISSALMLSITAGLTTAVYAEPPTKPSNSEANTSGGTPPNGQPGGGQSASNVSHAGEYEYSESVSESDKSFATSTGGKNTILVTDGTLNLIKSIITKTGDEDSGDSSDFYGTNAAILSINSSKIKITNSEITTNAKHANAVFAYGNSTIDISDSKINTTENNSGAIMVTGGGTLTATNVTAETNGNSSAPIRSDRGGGTMVISGGEYTSNGVGSPVIYSTADVTVKDGAKLTATVSEGAVIEGSNSVTLDGVSVDVTNTKLNGNSETYKSFFIYQSMSGDAEEGTGTFKMSNSNVTNHKGDIFFITNTTANISLSKNNIQNEDESGVFLKATSGKWGTAGKNGGHVVLTSEYEPIYGDIIVDNISTANLTFNNRTSYKGTINGDNTASSVKITLDSKSRIILTGDSYITELSNEVTDNSNIYANGHKLYVNGEEVTINQSTPEEWTYDFTSETTESAEEQKTEDKTLLYIILAISGVAFIAAAAAVFIILSRNKKRKQEQKEKEAIKNVADNTMKKPWDKA